MKVLVVDPVGGISGDMLLGGLIHLGCPVAVVEEALNALGLPGWRLDVREESVCGIACRSVNFLVKDQARERTLAGIVEEILPGLAERPRAKAVRIFEALARAEAAVHDVHPHDVHFHEVGALDSILDICGIAVGLDYLGVEEIRSRPVPLGSGLVEARHGSLPVPAPATLKLLEGFPVRFEGPPSELATPTGAAVIAALAKPALPEPLIVRGSGYGCGARRFDAWPNLCRLVLCETAGAGNLERVVKVESDIDDMTPEDASYAAERISEAGALDTGMVMRVMKHGRPGLTMEALCSQDRLAEVIEAFFVHTPTIGVRYHVVERVALPRISYRVKTAHGEVAVKEVRLPDGSVRAKPEHADICGISRRSGLGVQAVRAEVERVLRSGKDRD